MRKLFVLGVLMGFAISTTLITLAQAVEFKASGMMQFTTYVLGNYTFNNSAPLADKNKPFNSRFMDMRWRQDISSEITRDLKAVLKLEMDSTNWGDTGDGRNNIGKINADRAGLEIRNAYMDWNTPYVPVNLKVGVYGNYYRPHFFMYTDAIGVNATYKLDPVTINPFYFRGYSGVYDKTDSNDYYGLVLDYTGKVHKFGAYALYVYEGDFDAAARAGSAGLPGYPYPGRYTPFDVTRYGDFYWAGVYTDGGYGNLLYRFDALMDWGKLKDRTTPSSKDVDYLGWAAYGKVWLDFNSYQVGLVGMYSSGDDVKDTTKVSGFRLPPGSESYALFMEGLIVYPSPFNPLNGYMTFSSDAANNAYNFQPYRGFGGTSLAKAFGALKPTDWLTFTLSYSFIGDTVKNGNRFGSGSDKDLLGQEVDLYTKIQFNKNLSYDIGLGYLFSGDALKRNDATDPENAWAFITRLLLLY